MSNLLVESAMMSSASLRLISDFTTSLTQGFNLMKQFLTHSPYTSLPGMGPFNAQFSISESARYSNSGFILTVYGVGVLLLIILIASLVLFRSFCRKKKMNKVLEEKAETILKQKNRLLTKTQSLEANNLQLKELSQFKDNLTHMIAHDMKNPLNAIIGLASAESSEKNLDKILQSSQQIMNMIDNMLEVQKFEEANISLNIKAYKLSKLIEEAILPLAVRIEDKQININIEVSSDTTVFVDGPLIIRVIGNLLSNALKYAPSHSSIDIKGTLCESSNCIFMSVTDHGVGIPKHQQPHIFEKYWRGESDSADTGSTGLGLTFCKLVLKAHGSEITVSSIEKRFTTFQFTLPTKTLNELSEIKEMDPELILDAEAHMLASYHKILSQIKIHEIGKILRVVKGLDELGIKSKWKNELVSATFNANEKRFNALIKMLGNI